MLCERLSALRWCGNINTAVNKIVTNADLEPKTVIVYVSQARGAMKEALEG